MKGKLGECKTFRHFPDKTGNFMPENGLELRTLKACWWACMTVAAILCNPCGIFKVFVDPVSLVTNSLRYLVCLLAALRVPVLAPRQ